MSNHPKLEPKTLQELKDMANKLRIHSVTSTTAAESGHPTSCASMAELMSVLFFHTMRHKISDPRDASSDRFILSKGHSAPILYACWAEAGLFPTSDLLNLRKIDSDLEGHPTPRLSFVDVATGSLGQGLSVGCGMAYVGKYIDKAPYRVYVLLGDGESAEGSVWEAFNFASYYKLDNLCVIIDVNRLGQSEPTCLEHNMDIYRKRCDSFGFHALVVDGHDIEKVAEAFHEASITKDRPTILLAKTLKGKGFPEVEDKEKWHGTPLGARTDSVVSHISKQIKDKGLKLHFQKPLEDDVPVVDLSTKLSPPAYKLGEKVATRQAYGTALVKLGKSNPRVIALDGDTRNSTFSEMLLLENAAQFIQCFDAEQNLVGVGIGTACRDRVIAFVSTFAVFFTRAFDQIRMGAVSQTNCNFVGSHCGLSIGEDGPSLMGLEDIALFRSIPNATIFYPSDAVSCERATELAAQTQGICFVRTTRRETAVIYDNDEVFHVGKAKVVKKSEKDQVLIIGGGITLHEGLRAAKELEKFGISARVMDLFTVKPIDSDAVIRNANECSGRIVTVEDHYPEGGIGEAVLSVVSEQRNIVVRKLAVLGVPRSGQSDKLMDMFGISAKHVVKAVQDLIKM